MSSALVPEHSMAMDEDLVTAAQAGDEAAFEALLHRYRRIARARARAYFLAGADHEDLVQEGMIGLYKAIRHFDEQRAAGFHTFAELCVSRQILTAVRRAKRLKNSPLDDYVPLHRPVLVDAEEEWTLAEMLPEPEHHDPAERVLFLAWAQSLRRHVEDVLSDLEAEILRMYVDGRSYQEIADTLHRRAKTVDNALQRIKRKIAWHQQQWDAETA